MAISYIILFTVMGALGIEAHIHDARKENDVIWFSIAIRRMLISGTFVVGGTLFVFLFLMLVHKAWIPFFDLISILYCVLCVTIFIPFSWRFI